MYIFLPRGGAPVPEKNWQPPAQTKNLKNEKGKKNELY